MPDTVPPQRRSRGRPAGMAYYSRAAFELTVEDCDEGCEAYDEQQDDVDTESLEERRWRSTGALTVGEARHSGEQLSWTPRHP